MYLSHLIEIFERGEIIATHSFTKSLWVTFVVLFLYDIILRRKKILFRVNLRGRRKVNGFFCSWIGMCSFSLLITDDPHGTIYCSTDPLGATSHLSHTDYTDIGAQCNTNTLILICIDYNLYSCDGANELCDVQYIFSSCQVPHTKIIK